MRVPRATYRVQLRPEFGFDDAAAIVPYLRDLGISDLYSSPVFRAREGSTHGYDVVDPHQLNPGLGGEEAFGRLAAVLREHGMGLLLDIVPNHMAASPENPWWVDLLEYGPASRHSSFFDIDWTHMPGERRPMRILLPILGRPYGEVLEAGEIQIRYEDERFVIRYWDHVLPVAPDSWSVILQHVQNRRDIDGTGWRTEVDGLCSEMWRARGGDRVAGRLTQRWKDAVADIARRDETFLRAIEATVDDLNGRKGEPESFDELDRVLEDQWYRLAYWRTAGEAINYRRFFDVTDLVGVRVEDPEVFEQRHELLFELLERGDVGGLRIDHIDGLYDPAAYLQQIQDRTGGTHVIVEKILGRYETLPAGFACAGTTGYDFLATLNELLTDAAGLEKLRAIWRDFTRDERDFDEVVRLSKKDVIATLFPGEMRALAAELAGIAATDRDARDFLGGELEDALVEVTAALDVYRSYVTPAGVSVEDEEIVRRAITRARKHASPALDPRTFDFIQRVLLLDPPRYLEGRRGDWAGFVMRWQQFTGRAMAKGVEDTTFYVHAPLLALNEVGGEPDLAADADTLAIFHEEMRSRPSGTMNATATHDTKRGEDARARLLVLSEMSSSFERRLHEWGRVNHPSKRMSGDRLAPSRSEEVILYQTLLGAWPMSGEVDEEFRERIAGYLEKALREAKQNTSWISIDAEYETAVKEFAGAILDDERFRSSLADYQGILAWYGWINSLSQVLLKCSVPGVPDVYQGCEGWDLSLVDPDNRRPVNFDRRREWIETMPGDPPLEQQREWLESWRDGRVKMHVLRAALAVRQGESGAALTTGEYLPLDASGSKAAHVCAFARRRENRCVIVVVPRLIASLADPGILPTGAVWEDTRIEVPRGAPAQWTERISGQRIDARAEGGGIFSMELAGVLNHWPLALLEADAPAVSAAGAAAR